MKTVWKIGSRWDDLGRPEYTIFDESFKSTGTLFAYTDYVLQVSQGDLVCISDGYDIIALAKALSPGFQLSRLDRSNPKNEPLLKYMDDPKVYGFWADIKILKKSDTFKHKRCTMFCRCPSGAEKAIALEKKYFGLSVSSSCPFW